MDECTGLFFVLLLYYARQHDSVQTLHLVTPYRFMVVKVANSIDQELPISTKTKISSWLTLIGCIRAVML